MTIIGGEVINQWIASPYATVVLGALSFSESAFFILPPELLLIPMALANKNLALWFGLVTTIASVAGAAFGYFIGKKGGRPILEKLFSLQKIEKVEIMFNRYDSMAIFLAAFTPIPFKVFTIAAGVFDLDFKRFLLVSLLGRGTRYMILAGLVYLFGEAVANFLLHDFDKFVAVGTVGLLTVVGIYKLGIPFLEQRVLKESIKDRVSRLLKFGSKD